MRLREHKAVVEKENGKKENGKKENKKKENGEKENGEKENGEKENGKKENEKKENEKKENGEKGSGIAAGRNRVRLLRRAAGSCSEGSPRAPLPDVGEERRK